jgi:predicted RNase H-like HicB family nuclease
MKNYTVEPFNLSLNAIMIQDKNLKGFTAYFKQFPNVIVEGENEKDVMTNLFDALHDVFKYKSESETTPSDFDNLNIIEKSINFKLA